VTLLLLFGETLIVGVSLGDVEGAREREVVLLGGEERVTIELFDETPLNWAVKLGSILGFKDFTFNANINDINTKIFIYMCEKQNFNTTVKVFT